MFFGIHGSQNIDNVCDFCHDKYYFKNKCVDECSLYTQIKSIDQNIKTCLLCEKFIENRSCVNECSENYIADNSNICICDTAKYVLNQLNQCLLTCPENTILDDNTKKCESIIESSGSSSESITSDYCKLSNKILENNQCVDLCSSSYSYDALSI